MIASILEFVVSLGIIIYGIRRFLVLRKYWQFRQEQIASESISVVARLLSLLATLPFLIKFILVDKNFILASKELLDVIITGSIMLIGTGIWVQANHGKNPLKLLIKATQQERKELLHIQTNDTINVVLAQILFALKSFDEQTWKEHQLYFDEFASTWQVTTGYKESSTDILLSIVEYIALKPPIEQVAQLKDLVSLLFCSLYKDWEILYQSVENLQKYVGTDHQSFEVVVVPQNEKHYKIIQQNVLESLGSHSRNGGVVYIAGKFYSYHIANEVSLLFVKQELFSLVEATQP